MFIRSADSGVLIDLAVNALPDLCARRHDGHPRPVDRQRDTCTRRLVRGRTASVLRGLAIGARSISRVPLDPAYSTKLQARRHRRASGTACAENLIRPGERYYSVSVEAGCLSECDERVRVTSAYTVTSPSVFPWIVFPVRVPDASSIRKHMIADLRRQLERMLTSEIEGQG
jgi:hypothetical protein